MPDTARSLNASGCRSTTDTPRGYERRGGRDQRRGLDVDNLKRIGDYVTVDAQETLATFMVGSVPSAGAFYHHMGLLIQRVLRNRETTTLRLYGGMVDVLWKHRREAEYFTLSP